MDRKWNKKHSLSLIMLGIHYICLNMGQFIHIGRINLSWITAIVLIVTYLGENRFLLTFSANRNIRYCCYVMLAWVAYGITQIWIVTDLGLFLTFYFILINNVLTVIMTFLIVKRKEDLKFAVDMFAVAFVINLLGGIYEYITQRVIIDTGNTYEGMIKIGGFIGNFNNFCAFLFIGVVVFCLKILSDKSLIKRLFYCICIAVAVYFMFFNGSRGGIYSLYIFIALWPLFWVLGKIVKNEKNYNKLIICLGTIVCILGVVFVYSYGFYNALALLDRSGGGDIGSDRGRVQLILGGIRNAIETYGYGIGAGQSMIEPGINLHCFFVEILAEYGVFFGTFVTYLSVILFIKRKNNVNIAVDSLLQAAGYAFVLVNITPSSINAMRVLWIYLSIVLMIKEMGFEFEDSELHNKKYRLKRGKF